MSIYVFLVIAACSDDWEEHENHCYKKFNTDTSWDKARTSCMSENGDLAYVKDEDENNFVTDTFGGGNWLGFTVCLGNNVKGSRVVCDAESNEINLNKFNIRELDLRPRIPGATINDYAVLNQDDGSWKDNPKMEEHSYICKKPGILSMI